MNSNDHAFMNNSKAMQWLLKSEVMPRHRFWEFQQCNVEDVISHYKSTIMGKSLWSVN